jgi:hypothetical protein
MFTQKDYAQIDTEYFEVKTKTQYHIVLKSKNTGHFWDIEYRGRPGGRSLLINHKHKESQPFHPQNRYHPRSVADAQRLIREHDVWQMNGRKSSKE